MRLLVKFTREERVKYISHLDLMRTMQRAVRRAGIPIAWSQGFNPHPIMAFASALPVGVTSEGEYMDIELSEPISLPVVKEQLNHALPKGITILEAVAAEDKTPSLMSLIERADYRVTAAGINWDNALKVFMETPEIWVEKKGKKGTVAVNLKEIVDTIVLDEGNKEVMYFSMNIGSRGSLKPESVVRTLLTISEQDSDRTDPAGVSVAIHRTGLYLRKSGEWVTPLALKKD